MLDNFSGLIISLVVAAASLPQVVNYPKPELRLDMTPFQEAGCTIEENGNLNCDRLELIGSWGCDRLKKPSDLLGGLKPSVSLAICGQRSSRSQPAKGDYFYRTGGLLPTYIRYVVFLDGQFQLIKNQREFQNIFAPIESSEEALAYALATKNLEAYYEQKVNLDYVYFVDKIEDTHVEKTSQGYIMNLYQKKVFGCGPHPISTVNVLVTSSGNVKEVSRKEVYKNPREDRLCVD